MAQMTAYDFLMSAYYRRVEPWLITPRQTRRLRICGCKVSDLPILTLDGQMCHLRRPYCRKLSRQFHKINLRYMARAVDPSTESTGRLIPCVLNLQKYPTYSAYEKAINLISPRTLPKKRRALRNGYVVRRFAIEEYNQEVHAINTSMFVRSCGMVINGLRKPEALLQFDDEPRADAIALCPCHWTVWWGVFKKVPGHHQNGVPAEEKLVAYTRVSRYGEVVRYRDLMGHKEHLEEGVMVLLHLGITRWLMQSQEAMSKDVKAIFYGALEHGREGLLTWKRRVAFEPVRLELKAEKTADLPCAGRRSAGMISDLMAEPAAVAKMDKIVALCKRRGFIFQSSEIYGGLNGAWDYGPLGVELKRNLKDYWWKCMTQVRDDIVGFDGSILMNRAVWQASGHEATFSDPLVECLLSRKRYRADQIEPQSGTVYYYKGITTTRTPAVVELPFAVLVPPGKPEASAQKVARQFYVARGYAEAEIVSLDLEKSEAVENTTKFNPENGSQLSEPRVFNLMLKTYIGPVQDDSAITYLRPETAQAMFVQFKNVLDVSQKKLPFGIAQIGKAFRNEINPRNFTFRSREFEQMELEFFIKPGTGPDWLNKWLEERLAWYEAIGIPRAKIHVLTVPEKDRAFYSQGTYDLEYEFPFGIQELEGIAHRGNYDLKQHQEHSGKPLEYFDEESKTKYLAEVVEPSAGVDRTVLALLCEAFDEETVKDEESGKEETRTVLRFAPRMAPIKAAVFPLLKNKPELVAIARDIYKTLQPLTKVAYADSAAIGRRYRRMDEVGTPYGITVDFETLEGAKEASISACGTAIEAGQKDTVTLRHRDTMKQERIAIADLPAYLLVRVI